eukprot:IDg9250t1
MEQPPTNAQGPSSPRAASPLATQTPSRECSHKRKRCDCGACPVCGCECDGVPLSVKASRKLGRPKTKTLPMVAWRTSARRILTPELTRYFGVTYLHVPNKKRCADPTEELSLDEVFGVANFAQQYLESLVKAIFPRAPEAIMDVIGESLTKKMKIVQTSRKGMMQCSGTQRRC